MSNDSRTGILNAVSSWLKLLALVVLIAEAMILAAMKLTPETNPLSRWYPLFMLLFLLVVVIGIFLDRYTQTEMKSRLTLELEDRKVTVETANITRTMEEVQSRDVSNKFVDSQNGLMFSRPKLPGWSSPLYLNPAELAVKRKLRESLDGWEEEKKFASVIPLMGMFTEAKTLLLEHGSPVEVEFTDDTSTRAADMVLGNMTALAEESGKPINAENLVEMRRQMVWGEFDVEHLVVQNTFSVSILDKSLAKNSPVAPTLATVFLTQQRQAPAPVERLVANENSIMWGSTITVTKVLVKNEVRDLTMYNMNNLVESSDRVYLISITFYPVTESEISVWEELKDMFKSFRILAG